MTASTDVSPTSNSPHSEDRPPRLSAARLAGTVKPVAEVTQAERDRMFALLAGSFFNVTQALFKQDLAEKEWVVLLAEAATGEIQGFSTLMRLQVTVDRRPVVAFFSGDTIIHRDYWGESELPRIWGRHVFTLAETVQGARVFWFLICSGYKTYRFLPIFFREFYPTYTRPMPPDIKRTLDALGRQKFPDEYEAASGVIRFPQAAPLRPGIAEITPHRLKDPHVAFFVQSNPGHLRGDDLACLAELRVENLTPAGRKLLGR